MNRTYRLVWNESQGAIVPAPEIAHAHGKQRGKRLFTRLVLALALSFPAIALALPSGGQISTGSGSIGQSGNTLTVTQTSPKLAVDWQDFNVAPSETVNFNQPGSNAIALNRILGSDPSAIYGRLNANGQVFLLNPNGLLFGPGAQVNVGGLVASTLGLSDADFLAGRYRFTGSGGHIVNQGAITARNGGYIALLGGQVSNEGLLQAKLGTVALAAGNQATLDFSGDQLVSVQIDQGALDALAQNKQLIRADGGTVLMTALAADALLQSAVNNDGVIEARTLENHHGTIKLLGDRQNGSVNVAGTLDASAPDGGNGGFIETSAAHVRVADSTKVTTAAPGGKTGTWLIDPNDYTIAASGGNISGATLSGNLGTTDVVIDTATQGTAGGNGDILVNDAVTWSADHTLTLAAERNIAVNADITASGNNAGLVLTPNGGGGGGSYSLNPGTKITLSGSSPSLTIAGTAYTVINDVTALQNMNTGLAGHYALGSDIDASATSGWNGGAGFVPVGDYDTNTPFTGKLDGLGHKVDGLHIDRASFASTNGLGDGVGLFGKLGGEVTHVGLTNAAVSGHDNVGGLAGYNSGTISNSYVTGSVSHAGTDDDISRVGGLAGYNNTGTVSTSYSSASVSGGAKNRIGGLIGENNGSVDNVFATGSVSGAARVGGLVGNNTSGTIGNAYATGSVSGTNLVGGLVGRIDAGTVTDSYASGSVSGTTNVGGLAGSSAGTVTDSYWDKDGTGRTTSAGGTGLSSAEMQQQTSFTGFDFSSAWIIYDGHTAPLLRNFMTPLTVTAGNDTKTYNGLAYSGGNGVAYSVSGASVNGTVSYGGSSQGATNAGTYAITPSGLWSTQHGYAISYANGTLTVDKAPLTVTAANDARTYDKSAYSGGNGVGYSGFVNGETSAVLGGTLSYGGTSQGATHAGSYTIVPSGLTSGNYTLTYANGTLTVNKAPITVSANPVTKTYDGTTSATGSAVLTGGTLYGGDSISGGTFVFANKNAGTNKTLNVSAVTVSDGNSGGNYSVTYSANTSSAIDKAPLTVSTGNVTKTYDGTTGATGTAIVTGGTLYGGDSLSGGTFVFTDKNAGTNKTLNVSSVTVNDGNSGNNYSVTYSANTASTIDPAALTITASNDAKTYDGLAYSGGNGVSYSGLVNGETSSVLGGALSYGGTSQGAVNAGSYTIVPSGLTSANYAITYANGTLTVNKAPLTVTAADGAKTYDGLAYSGGNGVGYSGFVNGETSAVLGGTLSYGGTSQGATHAGSYTIAPSGLTSGNYTLTYANGTLTVNKAPLTVTAANDARTYDKSAYSGGNGVGYNGFVNGETSAVLGGTLSYGGTSQGATNSGTYTIVPSGLTSGNYTLTYANGTLTVNPAALTISANPVTKTYDGTTSATGTAVVTGGSLYGGDSLSGGTFVFADKNAGTNKTLNVSSVTVSDGNSGNNYTITYSANSASTIDPAALTVTASNDAKTYNGLAYSGGNGVSYSGLVNGETSSVLGGALSYGGTSQGATNAGTYTIVPSGLTSSNYTIAYANGTLTITLPSVDPGTPPPPVEPPPVEPPPVEPPPVEPPPVEPPPVEPPPVEPPPVIPHEVPAVPDNLTSGYDAALTSITGSSTAVTSPSGGAQPTANAGTAMGVTSSLFTGGVTVVYVSGAGGTPESTVGTTPSPNGHKVLLIVEDGGLNLPPGVGAD